MEGQVSGGILDTNDIRTALRIVTKNWWILVSFVALFFIVGYIYAYKLPDVYAAKTTLLLQTNDKYNAGRVISSNYGLETYVNNSNEMSVIKSYDLLKKVVDKLNINVSYFISGRLRTTEIYTGVPFKITVFYINPAYYEKVINFKITDMNHYRISYPDGNVLYSQNGTFGEDLVNTNMKINISLGKDINQGYIDALKKIDYEFKVHNPANLVYQFQGALKIDNPTYTNILDVTLKDIIPMRAISFLDTLDNLYIQNTLQSQLQINENTLFYIDKQLSQVEDIMNDIEDTMQEFKEQKNILDLGRETEQYFSQYSKYDDQKTSLHLQIQALDDLERYIIEEKDPTFLPPSIYINGTDDFLRKSAEELYNMQLIKNSAINTSTMENMSMKFLMKRMDSLKSDLLIYIANSRRAINERINSLDQQISTDIGNIKTLPAKQRGLTNIQRKHDINEKLYDFLLSQRATTVIEKASIIPQTKVIETARSMGIVDPNRNKIYYTFMAIGGIIALIIIFIRITFYDRIENITELKLKTHLPILGEILSAPLITDLSIAVEDNPKSPLTESFRTMRTNLQYMAIDTSSKVILFTSNGPGEGKTFCTINMAAILAKAEKKVLVLEFDLHKPRISKALNITAEKGVSSIIIGQATIEECIKPTAIPGMDVIVCGPVPPNSSELILSEKVKDILNYAKENYDYAIVDTPPLGLISDAIVLIRMSDINLFVLNTRFAYKEAINYIQETVQTNKIRNFGFVLNNVKRKKSKYYYNRYNYGYYGGYGYGGYGTYR
jgi:capsular exopolysaccharide synthesis family protein